jgi:hypothetical protein
MRFRRYRGMVYRKPVHPSVDRWAHRQTLAGRVIGAALAILLIAAALIFADRAAAPRHSPWNPLGLARPAGHGKVGRVGADCRAALAAGGVSWQESPDRPPQGFCSIQDAVVITGGAARLEPLGAVMTCKQALAFAGWERQVVQPQALRLLGSKVASIQHYGAFSCRRMYAGEATSVSEHASADALDVAGFTLADGRRITVAGDWREPGPKGAFLHAARDGACGVFSVVLSPDYNAAHQNHLHLDMGAAGDCR